MWGGGAMEKRAAVQGRPFALVPANAANTHHSVTLITLPTGVL